MQFLRHLSDIWRHRALVTALTGRELKGRYRGSFLGFLWTFLNPLLLLLVYALVFSVYFRVQMDHYAVFVFTGLLPWTFFSNALMDGAGAVVDGGSLVTKVLFPLQVLPAVKVLAQFVNYLLTLPIMVVFLLAEGIKPHLTCLAFPLVALSQLAITFALALFLTTCTVFMRDTRHILGNLITLWFFLTPVLYPVDQVPAAYRFLVGFNPAATHIRAYQDIFFYGRWPDFTALGLVSLLAVALFLVAVRVFDSHKEYFAEKI